MSTQNRDGRGGRWALIRFLARMGLRVRLRPFQVARAASIGPRTYSVANHLSPELLEPVEVESRLPENELFQLFRRLPQVHKWHHYFDVYEAEFGRFRAEPVRMLEIGVFRGGSLKMWKEWLHPESVLVGLDVDSECAQHEDAARGIHVRIGDQGDPAFLRRVCDEFGPFDLILDDGGHTTGQMTTSFNHLFRRGLREGGVYMVEDTHTNFWPGYVDSEIRFLDFCRGLAELIHAPYFDEVSIDGMAFDPERPVVRRTMRYIEAWLHRVTFYDSVVVLEKRPRILPVHELR